MCYTVGCSGWSLACHIINMARHRNDVSCRFRAVLWMKSTTTTAISARCRCSHTAIAIALLNSEWHLRDTPAGIGDGTWGDLADQLRAGLTTRRPSGSADEDQDRTEKARRTIKRQVFRDRSATLNDAWIAWSAVRGTSTVKNRAHRALPRATHTMQLQLAAPSCACLHINIRHTRRVRPQVSK